jgi:hypothetical protein
MTGRKRAEGAQVALDAMRRVAQDWAEGAAEEDISREVRDPKRYDEQVFALADILEMVNDAARQVVAAKPKPPPPRRAFMVSLRSPIGITESFSIMEGDQLAVSMNSIITFDGEKPPARIDIPVQIIIR